MLSFFCFKLFATKRNIAHHSNNIMAKYRVVMLRHGESEWNQKNLFCGWYDADLSPKGLEQAKSAGRALRDAGYKFDIAYTSLLKRAQITLEVILKEIGQPDLLVERTWRLNERHYGNLTGLNKRETAAKYGEKQVAIWRRSFDIPPPPIESSNPYYAIIANDPRYKDGPSPQEFPKVESLKLTMERTIPYWTDKIVPQIKAGKRVLITAHGTSLRGLIKHIANLSEKQIMELNLPTGIPFVFSLDEKMKPVKSMEYLGDPDIVKKAIEDILNQGKAK